MDAKITQILSAIDAGESAAAEELLPLVYRELRALAAARLSDERPGQTLQPTALVHEAYLRLIGSEACSWNSRGHFFAAAAEAMRRVLIDRARRRLAKKHGEGRKPKALDERMQAVDDDGSVQLLSLHEALTRFENVDPDKALLVKLRHFAGLSEAQVAQALGISRATAARHWAYARAWLYDEILRLEGHFD